MSSARSPAIHGINPASAAAGITSVIQRAHCKPAMLRAVAHNTNPAVNRGCRRQHSCAISPPIE